MMLVKVKLRMTKTRLMRSLDKQEWLKILHPSNVFFSVCVCTYFNKAPGKRPELVPNHPVQDKEGHIRNHAGEDEAMRDQSRCFNESWQGKIYTLPLPGSHPKPSAGHWEVLPLNHTLELHSLSGCQEQPWGLDRWYARLFSPLEMFHWIS